MNPLGVEVEHVALLQAAAARHGAGRRRRLPGFRQKLDPFLVAFGCPEVEPLPVELHELRGNTLAFIIIINVNFYLLEIIATLPALT